MHFIKFLQSLLFIFASFSVSAQISESNFTVLRKTLNERINELRSSQEVAPLASNKLLKKAAKIQSAYMARTRTLTHSQASEKMRTPLKRVAFLKGYEFDLVGEKCALHKKNRRTDKNQYIREYC